MITPYRNILLLQQIRKRRQNRSARILNDLERYGEGVLQSEEMRKAFGQTHHLWATVGEHTMRVATASLMISYALKKLHVKVNIPSVVVGSLCHDLGILGRDEKYASDLECSREHPKDSVTVARELVDDLPRETEDIIERHMWPIGKSKAPNSVEGVVVSVADKISAVEDIIKGSEVKHTGVKNFVHDEKEKIKDML